MFQIRPRVPWGWRVRWRDFRTAGVANQWKACEIALMLVLDVERGAEFDRGDLLHRGDSGVYNALWYSLISNAELPIRSRGLRRPIIR